MGCSRCGVVRKYVNEYCSDGLLWVIVVLVVVGLLKLGQCNNGLHPDCGLLVTHSVEQSVFELLVRVVAAVGKRASE